MKGLSWCFLWHFCFKSLRRTARPRLPIRNFLCTLRSFKRRQRPARLAHADLGAGNILGQPEKGIDFTYQCSSAILNTGKDEFYQARWKKQDRRIELLMQRIGSDHLDKCDIDIAIKAQPYKSR